MGLHACQWRNLHDCLPTNTRLWQLHGRFAVFQAHIVHLSLKLQSSESMSVQLKKIG